MASSKQAGPLGAIYDFFVQTIFRRGDPSPPPEPTPSPTSTSSPGPVGGPPKEAPACLSEEKVQDLLQKIEKMITEGRKKGAVESVNNLENWRNKGGDRKMPASAFESQEFVLKHLAEVHRQKFLDGAKKRLGTGELAPGKPVEMHWTDSKNAPADTDLFYALGGFTIRSDVKCSVTAGAAPGKFVLHFDSWTFSIYDEYNWDHGKKTPIPGIGLIYDDDMKCLETMGYGKSFKITTDPIPVKDPRVVGDATIP